MKILVTGSAGVLGGKVAQGLSDKYELRAADILQADGPANYNARLRLSGEFVQVDFTDYAQTREVVEGCDIVVHCAAIHPWKQYTDEQYIDNNVKAAYQVFKACAEIGVQKLVFTSSIAAVGYNFAVEEMPVTEEQSPRNTDLYSLTKTLCEEIIRMFNRRSGLNAICLRPTNFVPREGLELGRALLTCSFTHPDDVASAHLRAVETEVSGVEYCFIAPRVPYTTDDIKRSQTEPAAVIEQYYPGAPAWFAARGIEVGPLGTLYSTEKAKNFLGWQAEWDFERWWNSVT
ncbi:MAG: NAD-dependent epimerase/dehydratase family protein [Candidatus Poribacteria bacterium]